MLALLQANFAVQETTTGRLNQGQKPHRISLSGSLLYISLPAISISDITHHFQTASIEQTH
jgi:hypothetical protein